MLAHRKSTQGKDLSFAINRLLEQQVAVALFCTPAVISYALIASNVIIFRYYMGIVFMIAESVASLFVLGSNLLPKRTKKKTKQNRFSVTVQEENNENENKLTNKELVINEFQVSSSNLS